MQWLFIALIIVLTALSVLGTAYSLRQAYKLNLLRVESAASRVRALTARHIDVYEKAYALVFFFGGDLSSSIEKKEFTLKDETPLSELPLINSGVDAALSELCARIEESESIMKDRGASFRKTNAEIEELERDLLSETVSFNRHVSRARLFSSFRPFKRLLKDLGKCPYRQIALGGANTSTKL